MKPQGLSRRGLVASGGLLTAGAALPGLAQTARPAPDIDTTPGRRLLAKHPSVDVHSHAGRSFLQGAHLDVPLAGMDSSGFEAQRMADMRTGHLTAGLFAAVADLRVLGVSPRRGIVATRTFEPGEAYRDFQRQMQRFTDLSSNGTIELALSANAIRHAHAHRRSVVVLASEGAGFIETRLERLDAACRLGLRSVTLVHYRPSQYGDLQTQPPVHGGLSDLGRALVTEMNRLGIIIDMAHASFETTRDVVDLSSAPIMISHSHLARAGVGHPRLLSREHASLVVGNHGLIGAWPSGVSSQSMSDFVDEILRLTDHVGIEHVAIGTDLDANYRPVLTDYAQFEVLATLLLARGLDEMEAAQVLGLNFLRVFEAVAQAGAATG